MYEVGPQTRERNRQGAEVMGTIFCFCGLRLCGELLGHASPSARART